MRFEMSGGTAAFCHLVKKCNNREDRIGQKQDYDSL